MSTSRSERVRSGAVIQAAVWIAAALFSTDAVAQIEGPRSAFFTTSDGVKIHYLTQGDTGSHVILIHGYTSNAQSNWFSVGIPQLLAKSHRVVALDTRNHGKSDTVSQRPGGRRGGGDPLEVKELMEHLKIERAHIHGYSMGGSITLSLMKQIPERFITASFGGSGIREESQGERYQGIDLSKIDFPVMAINGSQDRPYEKTVRMTRELKDFTNFVLPGFGHMNAMTPRSNYAESLAFFIDSHDPATE